MAGDGDTISGSAITVDASGMLNMTATDTISGGSLLVYGTLNADGTADTIADSSNVTVDVRGLLNVNGSLTLTADTVSNDQAQGIVVSGGSLTLNSGTTITNTVTADTITVDWRHADARRHHRDLRRHHHRRLGGTLTMAGTADAISGAILDNSGTFNANGTDTLTADTVSNSHAMVVSGSLTLNSGTTITNAAPPTPSPSIWRHADARRHRHDLRRHHHRR